MRQILSTGLSVSKGFHSPQHTMLCLLNPAGSIGAADRAMKLRKNDFKTEFYKKKKKKGDKGPQLKINI